jgi:hypothetical protein
MGEDTLHWQNQALPAAWEFARKCAELSKRNPNESVLDFFMNTLMTELWDNGFNQSVIRTAFENAIADMPRYAAGEGKRG